MNLRDAEARSIREFLVAHGDKLSGRVIDYGCGQQPYRSIVESFGGKYHGWDRPGFGGSVVTENVGHLRGLYDTVICTQVIQYADDPFDLAGDLRDRMREGSWLLMTGPTNWPVIEDADRWRFTPSGVVALLAATGFGYVDVQERHHIEHGGERWLCGWSAVAR